jgi:hypothetical protein
MIEIEEIIEQVRKSSGKLDKIRHSNYDKVVKHAQFCEIHATETTMPSLLFEDKAPNESKEQRDYREKSYQPTTHYLWQKALSACARITNTQNVNYHFGEDNLEYFVETFPKYNNISTFINGVLLPKILSDPNAVLCVKPYKMDINPTDKWQPYPVIYSSTQVIQYSHDELLVLTSEKSEVKYGNRYEKTGLIFELYTKNNIIRIEQVGVKNAYEFNYIYYFNETQGHGLNANLWEFLKGDIDYKDNGITYRSFFAGALPMLNNALYNQSSLSTTIVAHVFPQRVEYGEKCSYQDPITNCQCQGGRITMFDDVEGVSTPKTITCPSCYGSGMRRHSITGVYVHTPPTRDMNTEEALLPFPGVAYVAPDTAILDFLRTEINTDEKKSFEFMGLELTNQTASGKETATGRIINREDLFAFLTRFSNNFYSLVEWLINTIIKMREGSGAKLVQIKTPTSFEINTIEDLTLMLSESIKNGLPQAYSQQVFLDLEQIRVGNNKMLLSFNRLKEMSDTLYFQSNADAINLLKAGLIEDWEYRLHTQYSYFYKLEGGDDLLEKDILEAVKILQDSAKLWVRNNTTNLVAEIIANE